MHADGFGDIMHDQRLHGFIAVLEKILLVLDDTGGYLEQGFVADFEAANQPARFLKLDLEGVIFSAATERSGIQIVDSEPRSQRAVQLDGPVSVDFANEDVGHDVLGGGRVYRRPGARMAGPDQSKRKVDLVF